MGNAQFKKVKKAKSFGFFHFEVTDFNGWVRTLLDAPEQDLSKTFEKAKILKWMVLQDPNDEQRVFTICWFADDGKAHKIWLDESAMIQRGVHDHTLKLPITSHTLKWNEYPQAPRINPEPGDQIFILRHSSKDYGEFLKTMKNHDEQFSRHGVLAAFSGYEVKVENLEAEKMKKGAAAPVSGEREEKGVAKKEVAPEKKEPEAEREESEKKLAGEPEGLKEKAEGQMKGTAEFMKEKKVKAVGKMKKVMGTGEEAAPEYKEGEQTLKIVTFLLSSGEYGEVAARYLESFCMDPEPLLVDQKVVIPPIESRCLVMQAVWTRENGSTSLKKAW